MKKALYIFLGSFFTLVGFIGVFVPGLPTTVFLLIASFFFIRSSPKLHDKLLNHKLLGKFLRDYHEHRGMPLNSKIIALILMWTMISLSVFVFIKIMWVKIVVASFGLVGTIVILSIKTIKAK